MAPGVLHFDPWESWSLGVNEDWTRVSIEFKVQSRKPILLKIMRGNPVQLADLSIPEGLTSQQVAWAIDKTIRLPVVDHVDINMLWQDALRREWVAAYLSSTHTDIARWAANDLRCISDEMAGKTSLCWEYNWKTRHWGS
jgi:hypothetical protein